MPDGLKQENESYDRIAEKVQVGDEVLDGSAHDMFQALATTTHPHVIVGFDGFGLGFEKIVFSLLLRPQMNFVPGKCRNKRRRLVLTRRSKKYFVVITHGHR